MPYRASNGILAAEISDEEARAHYTAAELVRGGFGGAFVTAVRAVNGLGRVFAVAATYYEPVGDPLIDGIEDMTVALADGDMRVRPAR